MKIKKERDPDGSGWWAEIEYGDIAEGMFFDTEKEADEWINHHRTIDDLNAEIQQLKAAMKSGNN
jgi:hypothetical protein